MKTVKQLITAVCAVAMGMTAWAIVLTPLTTLVKASYNLPGGAFDPSSSINLSDYKSEGYTVTASGVPTGLKFDTKTYTFTGAAAKEGTYTVTFTAKKKRC